MADPLRNKLRLRGLCRAQKMRGDRRMTARQWEQWEELVGSTRARARRPFVGRGMLMGMAAVMQVAWT